MFKKLCIFFFFLLLLLISIHTPEVSTFSMMTLLLSKQAEITQKASVYLHVHSHPGQALTESLCCSHRLNRLVFRTELRNYHGLSVFQNNTDYPKNWPSNLLHLLPDSKHIQIFFPFFFFMATWTRNVLVRGGGTLTLLLGSLLFMCVYIKQAKAFFSWCSSRSRACQSPHSSDRGAPCRRL